MYISVCRPMCSYLQSPEEGTGCPAVVITWVLGTQILCKSNQYIELLSFTS